MSFSTKEAERRRREAKDQAAGYLATLESIEPDINMIDPGAFYASAAISLKRIADGIDRLNDAIRNLGPM